MASTERRKYTSLEKLGSVVDGREAGGRCMSERETFQKALRHYQTISKRL